MNLRLDQHLPKTDYRTPPTEAHPMPINTLPGPTLYAFEDRYFRVTPLFLSLPQNQQIKLLQHYFTHRDFDLNNPNPITRLSEALSSHYDFVKKQQDPHIGISPIEYAPYFTELHPDNYPPSRKIDRPKTIQTAINWIKQQLFQTLTYENIKPSTPKMPAAIPKNQQTT